MQQGLPPGAACAYSSAHGADTAHILVVDDDREICDLLGRFLEKHRLRVTAVRDARDARRAWVNGHYQLVVLDLMLPGEGGLDFARWLRSQSDVPIVMLTAMGEETDCIVGLELGADDYVPKPFNPRKSLARIRAMLRLPDGAWLTIRAELPPPSFWHATNFLLAFALMTGVVALLTLWAVRRLTAPVRTLAAAAEALGRDVTAPPLPETGPSEVATAAAAFNTMAARIRRFVQDRTVMLTAIGHDLRTPITRLKLRAEFMEDDEQRCKMLADLDEMEAMVAATLAFGRDAAAEAAAGAIDLAELCRTLLDEAGDARPEIAGELAYAGPPHLTVRARPLALKRALGNLATNAVTYGGGARIHMSPPRDKVLTLEITDHGPGIPPAELERVFEPFRRLEASRNRETGGMGLGLPIARNILRAHGGDVVLVNQPTGGLKAIVSLPI